MHNEWLRVAPLDELAGAVAHIHGDVGAHVWDEEIVGRTPNDDEARGFLAFWLNGLGPLHPSLPQHVNAMPSADWASGWNVGARRAYGRGVKDFLAGEALDGNENDGASPYETFTAPWEAWADGWNAAHTL